MPEIVKAGPNTAAYPMHAYMYEEIVAWERGVAAESAQVATTNRYKNYLSGPFNAWWVAYDAGRAEEPPPLAPEGFDAQMSADGLGFDLVGSGAPCGPKPPYVPRPPSNATPGLLPAGKIAGWAGATNDAAKTPSILPLMQAKVYGQPVDYAGMKFLRVS